MKRWVYVLMMLVIAVTMLGLLGWAATYHSVRGYSVARLDKAIAATVFGAALLAPFAASFILSQITSTEQLKSKWPILELLVTGFLLLGFFGPDPVQSFYASIVPGGTESKLSYTVAAICQGLSALNLRVGIRDGCWGKTSLSALTALGGLPILGLVAAWAVYLE